MKGVLHGRLDQSSLQFVGKRAGGQNEGLVEGIDAGCASPGVAHADDLYGPKDGFQRTSAEAAMCVPLLAVFPLNAQGGAYISLAAVFEMCLQ